MEQYFIGIDGPAGAGKTATAKAFADKYDFHYVDTGAFYRAFAVWAKMQPDCFDAKTNQPLKPEIEARINAENIEKGKKFLEENKQRPGVVTLPSGLQYEVIKEGNVGHYAKIDDQVQCHYEGTLVDGTLFDSSIKRGQPATFGVSQVIPGWVEALQLMPEGAKWKLYIPSDLGYGAHGAGEMIPPHSTLIFEVELLKILSK